jgi:hypothetical protein
VRKVINDVVDHSEKNLSFFEFRHLSSYTSIYLSIYLWLYNPCWTLAAFLVS